MKKQKTLYYDSETDDFFASENENFRLPENYQWVKKTVVSRFLSAAVYTLALVFSSVYCRLFLNLRIKNARILKATRKTGAFLYGNHTQPVGDVFNPALAAFPNRIYTVVSPANYALPVIRKILPYLGALPLPDFIKDMKNFTDAIEYHLSQKRCITIYPEAHVWEYYTGIRSFSESSFKFPVKYKKPVFTFTATYQKRRFFKRPKLVLYLDGPFYPPSHLTAREQAKHLRDKVYETMKERSRLSDCEYIKYVRRDK